MLCFSLSNLELRLIFVEGYLSSFNLIQIPYSYMHLNEGGDVEISRGILQIF